ncbi:unnamed protein product, partial [Prorocentrum cordatum]
QTIATGNVCTLRPQEESVAGVQVAFQLMLGKVQILEQYFIDAHLDYVFLQEGRARVEEVRTGLHYTMYVGAGDDDGGHGCQIWIRARSGFKVSSYAAVPPRLFWLTGRDACGLPLILVSAHAPTEASPATEREGFWDTLLSTMSSLQRRAPTAKIYMGIDANARVGPHHSGATGPCDPEEISQNGAALIATLQELQLAALNTFFNVGYTWRSGKGPTSRIDYLCGPLVDLPAVHKVHVPEQFQLSITTREDHRMVAAHMTVPTRGGDTVGPPAPFRFNKRRLGDTARAQQFARRMSELRLSTHGDIDDETTTFMGHPWISGDTWRLLRTLAPSRRTMYRARAEIFKVNCHLAFLSWAALCPSTFSLTNAPPTRLGWAAKCVLPSLRALRQQWRLLNAATTRLCSQLTALVRHFIHFDRQLFLETKAQEAQLAAVRRDWRTTFGIVRALSGRSASSSTHPVRLKSGALSSTEAERQGRWQEHFRDVFNGKPATMAELKLKPTPPPDPFASGIVVLPDAVGASLLQLGRNKGVGRDGVPSELLVAGGDAVNEPLAPIFQDIIDGERWPTSWTGGRMQNVYKKKGPREECDESRGIVLEDHAAKGFKQLLSGLVTPMYNAHMPESQHGAVAGRGTDLAAHLARSFCDYCTTKGLSCFVWFVDLVKAFDRVVREIVLGWPHAATDPEQDLRDLGLSDHQAQWIATWVARHGCLFEQWGAAPKVIRLLKNMHAASWFSYGDCDAAVATLVGGRQGCKYGAMVFNSTFSLAMVLIRDALLDAGIILRLPKGRDAFWAPPESGADHAEDTIPVVDAAFVDDECFMLTAPRAADFDSAIDVILTAVCNIYKSMNLTINWKPGKSECFLVYRGTGATSCLEKRRVQRGGGLAIAVPGRNVLLHVVPKYTHLGGVVCSNGSLGPAAQHLRVAAMKSYAPLATKLFGSPVVSDDLKFWMMQSLILSRLLHNVHILVPTRRFTLTINAVYMRVLRRIAGAPRFGHTVHDVTVRDRLGRASVDCLMMRARLRYLGRLLRSQPSALLAMLSTRPKDRPLPWAQLLTTDMLKLRELVAPCSHLPCPTAGASIWTEFILASPGRWSGAVNALHFVDSCCDAAAAAPASTAGGTRPHVCAICDSRFASAKALSQHMRIKHGQKCLQRFWAPAGATCLACGTSFGLRLLSHLCDSRRPKCWNEIRANRKRFPPLLDFVVAKLGLMDQELRREAQRAGHSHALAKGPARRADGSTVGRARL